MKSNYLIAELEQTRIRKRNQFIIVITVFILFTTLFSYFLYWYPIYTFSTLAFLIYSKI